MGNAGGDESTACTHKPTLVERGLDRLGRVDAHVDRGAEVLLRQLHATVCVDEEGCKSVCEVRGCRAAANKHTADRTHQRSAGQWGSLEKCDSAQGMQKRWLHAVLWMYV